MSTHPQRWAMAIRSRVRDQWRTRRRRQLGWIAAAALAGLLLAGVAGRGLLEEQQRPDYPVPAHASADGTGLVDGDGSVTVEIWLDPACPDCREFAREASPLLDRLVAEGVISRVYHPVSFLDEENTGRSSLVAASVACAADGDTHPSYLQRLLDLPAPDGDGLSADELIQVGGSVGLIDPRFAQCVRYEHYREWTRHVTAQAARARVDRTPTVRIDGAEVPPEPAAMESAVAAAVAAAGARG